MSAATTPSYCRLFLATPTCFDPSELNELLEAAISGGDIASLLVRHENAEQQRLAAMAVTKTAQAANIAVLIENDIETAKICGADGVHLDGTGSHMVDALEQLGNDHIVGVFCGNERHSAMSVGEAGADYVAFDNSAVDGENEPVVHWWARVFEVPCVLIEPLEMEQARLAVAAKVDFICPPESMWASKQAARETVRGYNAMIKDTNIETA